MGCPVLPWPPRARGCSTARGADVMLCSCCQTSLLAFGEACSANIGVQQRQVSKVRKTDLLTILREGQRSVVSWIVYTTIRSSKEAVSVGRLKRPQVPWLLWHSHERKKVKCLKVSTCRSCLTSGVPTCLLPGSVWQWGAGGCSPLSPWALGTGR